MSSDPGVFLRPKSDDSLSTLQRQAGCHDTECTPAGLAGMKFVPTVMVMSGAY